MKANYQNFPFSYSDILPEIMFRIQLTESSIEKCEKMINDKTLTESKRKNTVKVIVIYRNNLLTLFNTLKNYEQNEPIDFLVFPKQQFRNAELNKMTFLRKNSTLFTTNDKANNNIPYSPDEFLAELKLLLFFAEQDLAKGGTNIQLDKKKHYIHLLKTAMDEFLAGVNMIYIKFPTARITTPNSQQMSKRRRMAIARLKGRTHKVKYYCKTISYCVEDGQRWADIKVYGGSKSFEHVANILTRLDIVNKTPVHDYRLKAELVKDKVQKFKKVAIKEIWVG